MGDAFWQNFLLYTLYIWSLFWKGIALWRAAQLRQRNWFIVLVILNTIGLLELVYLLRFAKKRLTMSEVKSWKNVFVKKVPAEKNTKKD